MKVETPQILWNASEETTPTCHKKGCGVLNAALYSIDLLASGIPEPFRHVMVTAGNCSQINVWGLLLQPDESPEDRSIFQRKAGALTSVSQSGINSAGGLQYRCSLGRDNPAVNCVKFSPSGLHLAVGCDGTNLQIYSVPLMKRGNGNGRHFWSSLTPETCGELVYRVVNTGEGVTDVSWSNDGKRILIASIDHSVCMVQKVGDENWSVTYRSSEHLHFVQGVAYDPLGVYLASMSNDRSVRIYPRKANAKTIKKVLKPIKQQMLQQQKAEQEKLASADKLSNAQTGPLQASNTKNSAPIPSITPEQAVQEWLANSKFEVSKTRVIKYAPKTQSDIPRHCWFADENTLESFFRRLSWTVDGRYLICPAALHRPDIALMQQEQQQHAVLVFTRHNFDEPHKVLTGLKKPAVAVRPNPILFELPPNDKENARKNAYRSIFSILTWDSVIIYDTHHKEPLAFISGLHYANLTDAAWSADGHSLVVSSSDGYVSLIRFAPGELGTPRALEYEKKPCPIVQSTAVALTKVLRVVENAEATAPLPPCEPGPVQLPGPSPSKKAKTSTDPVPETLPQKRDIAAQPYILVPKKKKRVQPILVSSPTTNIH